jgi:hypothetical protein
MTAQYPKAASAAAIAGQPAEEKRKFTVGQILGVLLMWRHARRKDGN